MQQLEAYKRDIRERIEECRRDLAPLETGEIRQQSKTGDEPWKDTAAETIAHHKRTIAMYERILAVLDSWPRAG